MKLAEMIREKVGLVRSEMNDGSKGCQESRIEMKISEKKGDCISCKSGKMIPLYEHHPNWIKICNECGVMVEDLNHGPIPVQKYK